MASYHKGVRQQTHEGVRGYYEEREQYRKEQREKNGDLVAEFFNQLDERKRYNMGEDKAVENAVQKYEAKAHDLDGLAKIGADAYLSSISGSASGALALAVATKGIENAIDDDMMKMYMSLQGKAYGFKTDKDNKGGYPEKIVKEVIVDSLLKGIPLTQNCVNIIGNKLYVTKEGFNFLIGKLQNEGQVTELIIDLKPPQVQVIKGGQANGKDAYMANVAAKATWVQNGSPREVSAEIPIKGDAFTTVDAWLGKADRKIKARAYEVMTGLTLARDEEGEEYMMQEADVQVVEKEEQPAADITEGETSDVPDEEEVDEEKRRMELNAFLAKTRRQHPKIVADVCADLDVDPTKLNHLNLFQLETLADAVEREFAD